MEAAQVEMNCLIESDTYKWVPIVSAAGRKLLPLVWVLTYKFDNGGFFSKFNARICVRGDEQTDSIYDDNYAAILVIKTFRALMGITAALDLAAEQFDVTSAFLNSKLDENVYTKPLDGYQRDGEC